MTTFLLDQTVKLVRYFILTTAIAFFYSSNNAWAQSAEIQELRQEIETLKKQVAQLEAARTVSPPPQQPAKLNRQQALVAAKTPEVPTKEAQALKDKATQLEPAKTATPPQQPAELPPLQIPVAVKTPTAQTKKAARNPWQALQVNLSKADVTALLGKPGRIDKWKTGEAWYFPDPRGGEIDFNADEIVTGWLEP